MNTNLLFMISKENKQTEDIEQIFLWFILFNFFLPLEIIRFSFQLFTVHKKKTQFFFN